jgi:hypothetical protein
MVRGCEKKDRNIASRNGEKNKGSGKRKREAVRKLEREVERRA